MIQGWIKAEPLVANVMVIIPLRFFCHCSFAHGGGKEPTGDSSQSLPPVKDPSAISQILP